MKTCSPKGRDCIDLNFTQTFNCNMTCEGIYADVQWVNEQMEELGEAENGNGFDVELNGKGVEELLKDLNAKLNDLEKKVQLMEDQNSIKGQVMDKAKFLRLVSEYKQFKRNYVQHFRFNSAAKTAMFGEFLMIQSMSHWGS